MKRILILLFTLAFMSCAAGCSYRNTADNSVPVGLSEKYEILTEITVKNGDNQFDGVLYDNETAREFAEQLPITANLWNPAEDFAKAINLDEALNTSDDLTREYELGGLAYWPSGPSVAFFYNDNLPQTIVSVIPIGKLNDVVDLGGCEGSVTIEEKTVMPEESEINSSSENSLSTASKDSSEPQIESVSENSTENSNETVLESLPESVASSSEGSSEAQTGNASENPEVSGAESITEGSKEPESSSDESLDISEEPVPETPEVNGDTLFTAIADSKNSQTLYIWEDGNMPATTEYTVNYGGYADDPDFRPYIVTFPVPDGTPIKGAVLINAGGAFQYRSDQNEGTPVAQELSRLGYQSFVVNYRLRPYTQQEGALDLARAVRFVRKNADVYGIDEKDIAVMGFSAGGILAGEMLLNFDGTVNGTALDADYQSDALDNISADASACGMIYSFYGRLSFASDDVEQFRASDLPPTYFCYGTRDPFVSQFEKCIAALREAGVSVDDNVLEGRPHGYGYTQGWIPAYDEWLENIFASN